MKKIYFQVLFTVVTTTTFAQIKFAPEFGLNMAMQTKKTTPFIAQQYSTQTSLLSPGLTAGLNVDIKILRNLYINTGAAYVFNNVKRTSLHDYTQYMAPPEALRAAYGDLTEAHYQRVHYLKVPLYIMYKSGFEGTGRFTAGVGPYAAYAMGGNRVESLYKVINDDIVSERSLIHYKTNTEMLFGNTGTDDLKRWDYGMNACIGYESNVGLYFRGWTNYGLTNLQPEGVNERRIRNWGFGFSIGYLVGKDSW